MTKFHNHNQTGAVTLSICNNRASKHPCVKDSMLINIDGKFHGSCVRSLGDMCDTIPTRAPRAGLYNRKMSSRSAYKDLKLMVIVTLNFDPKTQK